MWEVQETRESPSSWCRYCRRLRCILKKKKKKAEEHGERHPSWAASLKNQLKLKLYFQRISTSGPLLLSHAWLFVTPWTIACQPSLFFTISQSLFKLTSIESVMPSNNLILCHPLLLPSFFPSIRVFSNESAHLIGGQSIGISVSTSVVPNEYSGLISFRIDWFDVWHLVKFLRHYKRSISSNLENQFERWWVLDTQSLKKHTIIKMLKHLRGTAKNTYERKGNFRKEMENRRKY